MDSPLRFIIIDDDALNNKICTISIHKAVLRADIKSFTDPTAGLEYIAQQYSETNYVTPTVLLLDLTMPGMDGWEFLKQFGMLDSVIKKQVRIYILSSSEDQRDMKRAMADEHVIEYLIKPLNKVSLELITRGQTT